MLLTPQTNGRLAPPLLPPSPPTDELPVGSLREIRLPVRCGAAALPTRVSISVYLRGSFSTSS